MEGGAVGHIFEMGLPKDYPSQILFNLVQRFQRRRFKCDLPNYTKPGRDGPFQNFVRQARSPFKMAAVTKNKNVFNCPLLL
jgi:hypothetical protein